MSTVEPIAIIGIGCRFPGGVKNTDDLWKLLADGVAELYVDRCLQLRADPPPAWAGVWSMTTK